METQKTVVIFGISSFLGSNLASYLSKFYRVIGTYHSSRVRIKNVLCMRCNVMEREQINFVISAFKPEFTIYAAGLSSIEICHYRQKLADALNTVGIVNCTEVSERNKARIIYISSDYVFSGADQLFEEKDNPAPMTVLGKTKVAGEYFIQKSCLNYVILRCSAFYGRSINPNQMTWFETLENRLIGDESFFIDDSVIQGYLDTDYLAYLIKLCIDTNTKNRLIQVTSRDFLSRYEFAKLYCDVFGMNDSMIKKGSWNFPESEKRAEAVETLFYKMSCENSEDLFNIELPTIRESLEFSFQKFGGKKVKKSGGTGKTVGVSYI